MKINLAKSAGFCVGVRRAINMALETAENNNNVEMLGDIVHNEDVIKTIEGAGIKNISTLADGKGKTLLIRAHGTSKSILGEAVACGYKIIDATCPMVKEIHKIAAEEEQAGRTIIIIGDTDHDEVRGIIGQLGNKPYLIDKTEDIDSLKDKNIKKAAVVIQSTQSSEKAMQVFNRLKTFIEDIELYNTICHPTKIKQSEAKKLPKENDAVLVIGSKTSANTKRLYEISKELNKKTFWVKSKEEINDGWFKGVDSLGIIAGASTPDTSINEIVEHLRSL